MRTIDIPLAVAERLGELAEEMNNDPSFWEVEIKVSEEVTVRLRRDDW